MASLSEQGERASSDVAAGAGTGCPPAGFPIPEGASLNWLAPVFADRPEICKVGYQLSGLDEDPIPAIQELLPTAGWEVDTGDWREVPGASLVTNGDQPVLALRSLAQPDRRALAWPTSDGTEMYVLFVNTSQGVER